MPATPQKKPDGLIDTLRKILFPHHAVAGSSRAPQPREPSAADRQREVEALLAQLFAKKSLVTSGRLQMLGFDKVRERLGQAWPMMQAAVYKITDDTIRALKAPEDIFLRYHDDYVLIFPLAAPAEALARAARIAEEIGERLEKIGEEALRLIKVEAHICAAETARLAGQSLHDILAALYGIVEADASRKGAARHAAEASAETAPAWVPACVYFPLWSIRKKALSAYLCEPEGKSAGPLDRDFDLLRAAKAELPKMQQRGDERMLVVPVRHGTLYNVDSSQKYQSLYRDIPMPHRRQLVFLVTGYIEGLPEKDAFWFLPALKAAGQHVFVEMPLRTKANFAALKQLGIDGLGVTADAGIDEAVVLGYLQNIAGLAHQAGLAQTFVLNIPTLSLATSASCMGFSWMGGPAIHGLVQGPDKSHQFRYAELFAGIK